MKEVIDQIDLSIYTIDELNTLVDRAKREVAAKQLDQVHDIRKRIETLAREQGMSIDELMSFDVRRKRGPGRANGEIRFRNPVNPEQTWGGRGKRPRWLQEALLQGAKLDDFAVAD